MARADPSARGARDAGTGPPGVPRVRRRERARRFLLLEVLRVVRARPARGRPARLGPDRSARTARPAGGREAVRGREEDRRRGRRGRGGARPERRGAFVAPSGLPRARGRRSDAARAHLRDGRVRTTDDRGGCEEQRGRRGRRVRLRRRPAGVPGARERPIGRGHGRPLPGVPERRRGLGRRGGSCAADDGRLSGG